MAVFSAWVSGFLRFAVGLLLWPCSSSGVLGTEFTSDSKARRIPDFHLGLETQITELPMIVDAIQLVCFSELLCLILTVPALVKPFFIGFCHVQAAGGWR